jgi:hypothetical protein
VTKSNSDKPVPHRDPISGRKSTAYGGARTGDVQGIKGSLPTPRHWSIADKIEREQRKDSKR